MFLCSFQVEKGYVLDLACFAHNINTSVCFFFSYFSATVGQEYKIWAASTNDDFCEDNGGGKC